MEWLQKLKHKFCLKDLLRFIPLFKHSSMADTVVKCSTCCKKKTKLSPFYKNPSLYSMHNASEFGLFLRSPLHYSHFSCECRS